MIGVKDESRKSWNDRKWRKGKRGHLDEKYHGLQGKRKESSGWVASAGSNNWLAKADAIVRTGTQGGPHNLRGTVAIGFAKRGTCNGKISISIRL